MNVHRNGQIYIFAGSLIDSVTYPSSPPMMLVHLSTGDLYQFSIDDVDSVTYSPGGPDGTAQISTETPTQLPYNAFSIGAVMDAQGVSPVTSSGICFGEAPEPTVDNSTVVEGTGSGGFTCTVSGLVPGTPFFARAFATNAAGTAYGNQVQVISPGWLNPSLTYGSVSDLDGNIYATIVFGNDQEWMAENLRVTHYANGDEVPNIVGQSQWVTYAAGAWCHYQNNAAYNVPLGKLYNWYAVDDARNICPAGWHVPDNADWFALESFLDTAITDPDAYGSLGYDCGGKMKTTGTFQSGSGFWNTPNTGATNASGFSGIPAGGRFSDFIGLANNAQWWSASASTGGLRWFHGLDVAWQTITKGEYGQNGGKSIRCVRD